MENLLISTINSQSRKIHPDSNQDSTPLLTATFVLHLFALVHAFETRASTNCTALFWTSWRCRKHRATGQGATSGTAKCKKPLPHPHSTLSASLPSQPAMLAKDSCCKKTEKRRPILANAPHFQWMAPKKSALPNCLKSMNSGE